jgi:hypothetical protein
MKKLLLAMIVISGCATSGSEERRAETPKPDKLAQKVAHQASFDMQCEPGNLTVLKISDDVAFMGAKMNTYGVRGCGRQATYKASCSMGMCSVFNEAQARSMMPQQ